MSTLSLDPGFAISETRWLIPDILPRHHLVLLDGAPGVGKSCFLAFAVSALCRYGNLLPDDSILYLATNKQLFLTQTFLQRHEPDYSRLHLLDYQYDPLSTSLHHHLTDYVKASLEQHRPTLLVIDSIEEIFTHFPVNSRAAWQFLFTELNNLALQFNCTIVVPRRQGCHESRSYGHFAREGSNFARFILTLHYHPIDPLSRILTLAKHQTGPMGHQFRARFSSNQMHVELLQPHQHVKPARAPATWRPSDQHEEETEAILDTIETFMRGHPAPKKAVREHVLSQGFSERAYNRFINKVKMPASRFGTQHWHFIPTEAMFYRSPRGQKALDNRNPPPRASTAADDQTPEKPAILTPAHPQPLRQAG